MKPTETDAKNAPPKPSFFQRTSTALNPRAFFRLSNLSAVSRESRMWGVKPKEDHEVENLTKEELESEMQKDPNVQKIAEATGTTIRTPEEFGPDPEVLRTKAARLAFEKKQKKEKRKKIGVIVGVLAIVAVIAVGTVVALSGGGDGEGGDRKDGGNGVITTAPTDSPTAGPFRITDVEDQEKLCKDIFKSDEFSFTDSADELVFAVCQPDQGKSIFTCSGNGDVLNAIGFCLANRGVCPCEPGLVINVTSLDSFGPVCVDEADNNVNNPVCVELEGDLAGLLAATDVPTNAPTKTPTSSPTATQKDS